MMNAQREVDRLPPDFEQARNSRQKARAAGLDPDCWYAVEYDSAVKKAQVREVVFWNTSIAVFRGQDGRLAAVQNRCPHRQLKLSNGVVEECQLRCMYHGWSFDREGSLVDYSHDSFGKPLIKVRLRTYPVAVRYGLIWLFPGDPALADQQHIPRIPELEGEQPWESALVDFTWGAHHSMVIDNISDFAHAFLHRKFRPFTDAKLRHYDADENRVFLAYDTYVGGGRFSGMLVDRERVNTNYMELCYQYPYHWSNTGDKIKNWCFPLPVSERQTRAFFVFYFDAFKIPFTSLKMPQWLTRFALRIANPLLLKPLLREDVVALEAEQQGYEQHWDAPPIELNPVIALFQQLTVRKWADYLERSGAKNDSANAE